MQYFFQRSKNNIQNSKEFNFSIEIQNNNVIYFFLEFHIIPIPYISYSIEQIQLILCQAQQNNNNALRSCRRRNRRTHSRTRVCVGTDTYNKALSYRYLCGIFVCVSCQQLIIITARTTAG